MLLILTHENSDFDAVASQWAAQRLHPDGVPLLARRVNRNVNRFLTLYWGAFRFRRADDWRRQKVDGVLLVDTQSLPSVRGLKSHTPVRVIDHHEKQPDKEGWTYHVDPVGATTTLLVEMIEAAGLNLTGEEATLFLLGIHEDTGNLIYDTTTARDVRAAAWLMEQGADLGTVRRFMEVPLTTDQQELYERLLADSEWRTIDGQSILIAAVDGPEDFEDEISSVVGRLRDALLPPAMFVLVALPHRVHLVARSSEDGVDVSVIARAFGGGGHSRAAAATIHDRSVADVQAELLSLLQQTVQPVARVNDLMSHHVKTVKTSDTAAAAGEEMQKYGHEGYPVVDENGRLAGLVTRRMVDRAVSHQLENLPVGQIMRAGQVSVRPSDSLAHLQELMVNEGWGQVPVVAENDPERLIGIVTRTDLLQQLTRRDRRVSKPNALERLRRAFDPQLWGLIETISRGAAALQLPIYFVGGLVRDVMLGKRALDIDIVVEGDAIQLVEWLVEQYGGKLYTHARFGTAKWILDERVWRTCGGRPGEEKEINGGALNQRENTTAIDFVTARTEFYNEPTVLPTVTRGSIKLDLLRRDFTINTLAIRLDGAYLGELLDFYGGLRDLEQGVIRVLHSLSFIDDPTRILRAVRFEQRLDFNIEPRTLELLKNSVELLPKVTGSRLWNELSQVLAEEKAAAAMARLDELGVLKQLHPDLRWTEGAAAAVARLDEILADPLWREELPRFGRVGLALLLWLSDQPLRTQSAVDARLRLSKELRSTQSRLEQLVHELPRLGPEARPSEVEKLLRPYEDFPGAILAARVLYAADERLAGYLDGYQQGWRHVETALDGHDLRALGIPPGPIYAELLDRLLAARLDGRVASEEEERALLAQLMEEGADSDG